MDELHTLRREKNPAFEYCDARYWLAYKNGRVVGRIAGLINQRYIEKWGHRYARFGWIDFIDDAKLSARCLEPSSSGGEKGMTGIHGPLGFTDMDREGMLVEALAS